MKDREELARVLKDACFAADVRWVSGGTERWMCAADAAVAWCAQRMLAKLNKAEQDRLECKPRHDFSDSINRILAFRRADWTAQEDAAVEAAIAEAVRIGWVFKDDGDCADTREQMAKIVAVVDAARAKGAR